jgi:hypothetical protein
LRAYTNELAFIQPWSERAPQENAKILHPPQNLIPNVTYEKYNNGGKSAFTKHNRLSLTALSDILNASFIRKGQFIAFDNFFSKAR